MILLVFVCLRDEGCSNHQCFFVPDEKVFIILNSTVCLYEKIQSIFLKTNNRNTYECLKHAFKQFSNTEKVYPVEGRLQKC